MARRAAPPYRAGVVGVKGPVVGGIGDAHARALKLHPKAEVVAICDIDPAGLEAYQAGHGPIAAFTEVTAMLEEKNKKLGTSQNPAKSAQTKN